MRYVLVSCALILTSAGAASAEPQTWHCHGSSVSGKVISPDAITMFGFNCVVAGNYKGFTYGHPDQTRPVVWDGQVQAPQIKMNVKFRDTSDYSKMKVGTVVRLEGQITTTRDKSTDTDYLVVSNAKITD